VYVPFEPVREARFPVTLRVPAERLAIVVES
jgi:hypothetical protein